jgi:glyceraldehyde 3-phosphate dehydrogenase
MTRVAINGFGRIGRAFFRHAIKQDDIQIVAINDLGDIHNLAYLLKYDSVYGRAAFDVDVLDGALVVSGHEIKVVSEKDPANLPWGDMQVDVVVESTGFFTDFSKANAHLSAGAQRVVISAPGKGEPDAAAGGATVLMRINEEKFAENKITSNASCTTNAASPLIAILDYAIGIEKAVLNTTHSYTASQSLVDGPKAKDMREGRAAALNMVPTSTGAAIATTKAYTQLTGNFDGIAVRVPTPAGSLADVTFISKRETTVEEVNQALREAASHEYWQGIFAVTEEPLVSSDIVGNTHASIADLSMTRVVGGNLVKVLGWYDNECGYAHMLVKHVLEAGKQL